MPLPNPVVFDEYDQGTDDPRLARAQLATLAQAYNDLLSFLAISTITGTPLVVGDGLEGAAAALRAKLDGATLLRSAAGLKVNTGTGPAQIPILDANSQFSTGAFGVEVFLYPQDTVQEGGQMTMLGAAAYPNGIVDLYQNYWRVFNGASPGNSIQFDLSSGRFYLTGPDAGLTVNGTAALLTGTKYLSTAANVALDSTYRSGIVDATAPCTITLPNLPDDAANRGWSVTLRNVSNTDTDDLLIAPPTGQAIDAAANNATKKLWPSIEVTLIWIGGGKWASRRVGWLPADRAIATAGTELNLDISLMGIPANARELMVVCNECLLGTGTGDWGLRVSIDGMATFDAGAAQYYWAGAVQTTAGGSAVFASAGASMYTLSFNPLFNTTTLGRAYAQIFIERPRATVNKQAWFSKATYPDAASGTERTDLGGGYKGGPHALDGLRLISTTAARPWQVGSTIEAYWR